MNPKALLLADGWGALLSSFMLSVVLVRFNSSFGVPAGTLYFLAFFPIVFAFYDFGCFIWLKRNHHRFIKAIAIANLLYCFLSIGLALFHYTEITYLGWGYFLLECAIVAVLVNVELKTARRLKTLEKS